MIDFTFEDIEKPIFFEEEAVKSWLSAIVSNYKKKLVRLDFILCDDEYLLDINKTHLQHDYYTDIITFPYQQGLSLEADIFISLDRVKENAELYQESYQDELLRVFAHGMLHLIGYSDKDESASAVMRSEEQKCIDLYKTLQL